MRMSQVFARSYPRASQLALERRNASFATLSLLLSRCGAIFIFFLTGLEELLELTGKFWVQLLESSQVSFCVGFPAHFCKEHSPILIGLGHTRFEFDSLIVMFKGFRIILRALLTQRESEVIMRLGKVRFITDRLFKLNLGRCEVFGVHEIDALVVKFESRTANLLSQRVTLNCANCTTSSAPRAHCSDCSNTNYTNTEIKPPLPGIIRPVTRKRRTTCGNCGIC